MRVHMHSGAYLTPGQCRLAACAVPQAPQCAPRQLATGQQAPPQAAAGPLPRNQTRHLSCAQWPRPAAGLVGWGCQLGRQQRSAAAAQPPGPLLPQSRAPPQPSAGLHRSSSSNHQHLGGAHPCKSSPAPSTRQVLCTTCACCARHAPPAPCSVSSVSSSPASSQSSTAQRDGVAGGFSIMICRCPLPVARAGARQTATNDQAC